MLKISININRLFPETSFYLNWACNSKNLKTKRKLLKKAIKEFKAVEETRLRERIKNEL